MEPEAFIGIDPEDTLEVNYGGGKFTLGVLPVGIYDRISSRAMAARQDAIRRVTTDLHARGLDPTFEVYEGVSLLDREISHEAIYRGDLRRVQMDGLKLGLRKHEGFRNKKGEDFPFATELITIEGEQVSAATPATMKNYAVNPGLVMVLWVALRKLHELPEVAKKA